MFQKWFGRCYDVYLRRIELAFVTLLLTNVVGLSLLLIIARNAHFAIWDPSALSRIIFASAFLACLYGGCLAARVDRHIAIDVFTSYLSEPARRRLEGITSAAAALASLILYYHALRYLNRMVELDSSIVPASDAWFLREWIWKLAIAGAFAMVALHFGVRSVRCFIATDDSTAGEGEPSN